MYIIEISLVSITIFIYYDHYLHKIATFYMIKNYLFECKLCISLANDKGFNHYYYYYIVISFQKLLN